MKTMKERLQQSVRMVCHRETRVNLAVVWGRGGLGKTTAIHEAIQAIYPALKYASYSGRMSSMGFWHWLETNREMDCLVVDDVSGIVNNEVALQLIKAACSRQPNGSPTVLSYTDQKGTKSFTTNASLVLITNHLDPDCDLFLPVKDRAIFLRYEPTHQELLSLMASIAEGDSYPSLSREDRMDALRLVVQHGERHKDLSLRHLVKALDAKVSLPADEVADFIRSMFSGDEDHILQTVAELSQLALPVKDAVAEFKSRTGLSRRTYFSKKSELKKRILAS